MRSPAEGATQPLAACVARLLTRDLNYPAQPEGITHCSRQEEEPAQSWPQHTPLQQQSGGVPGEHKGQRKRTPVRHDAQAARSDHQGSAPGSGISFPARVLPCAPRSEEHAGLPNMRISTIPYMQNAASELCAPPQHTLV